MLDKKTFWTAVRKRPSWLLLPVLESGLLDFLGDAPYLKLSYWAMTGKTLDVKNPRTFNEKIAWIKLNDRKPVYRIMADKLLARDFVAEHVGGEWLVPLVGSWDAPEDISLDELPERFVLKCSAGYGSTFICRDKASFDFEPAKAGLSKALRTDYFSRGREWAYKRYEPRIIAEEFVDDEGGERPADYKFMCMNGKVKLVCISRGLGDFDTGSVSFFFPDGSRAPFKRLDYPDYPGESPLPPSYADMVQAAEALASAAEAPFLRVDFYDMGGRPYFSEFTFYPCGGTMFLDPPESDAVLGLMLDLPEAQA